MAAKNKIWLTGGKKRNYIALALAQKTGRNKHFIYPPKISKSVDRVPNRNKALNYHV